MWNEMSNPAVLMRIGQRIKETRIRQHITQEELATASGVSPLTVGGTPGLGPLPPGTGDCPAGGAAQEQSHGPHHCRSGGRRPHRSATPGRSHPIPQQYTSVGTIIHMAVDGQYAGHIVISDVVKPNAKAAIAALHKAGVEKTVMLTGDAKKCWRWCSGGGGRGLTPPTGGGAA